MTITINVPNLDCVTTDPQKLYEFARRLQLLSHYVNCKAGAMVCREHGSIVAALRFEAMCEKAYTELPPEWRW
jgi:vacuolar-type H+-ATPase subunit E/Vma4